MMHLSPVVKCGDFHGNMAQILIRHQPLSRFLSFLLQMFSFYEGILYH